MKRLLLCLFILLAVSAQAGAKTYVPITFTHDGLAIQGRLTLPASPPPYRVIVIAPGSGANDKDATLPMYGGNVTCLYPGLYGDTLRPYKGLSDALADSGFAVLTYDKLEYTYTTAAGLGAITFHKLWLPVISALQYLKTRSDIDTNNMVLLGHSEGSTLIPYIARTQPGVKALISLAGPRRSAYDTLLAYQLNHITHTCGGDTAAAQNQGAQLMAYFSLIRSGNWNTATPPFAGVSAAVWSDYVKVADSVVINYNLAARPELFIGLGSDINVPVSTELSRFRQEITTPASFYELPGLNHYLTTATNPATSKALTDTIVYWLRRNTRALAIPEIKTAATTAFSVIQEAGNHKIIAQGESLQEIVVYNADGKSVYKAKATGASHVIAFAAPAAGLYLVSIKGSKTNAVLKVQW